MPNVVADDRARGAPPRHVVVTVHGIETFGKWQSSLARLVREVEPDCEVRNFSFNYFSVLAFWFPPTRWLVSTQVRPRHGRPRRPRRPDRLDIVAHSFGTHVVAWGLQRERRPLRVHTLILSGSVLKASHIWENTSRGGSGGSSTSAGPRQDPDPLPGVCATHRHGRPRRLRRPPGPGATEPLLRVRAQWLLQGRGRDAGHGFMREHWLPLLTGEGPIPEIDKRGEVTTLGGIELLLLQWLDPVKMCVVWGTVGLVFLFLVGLWANAAMTRDRLAAATDLFRSASGREWRSTTRPCSPWSVPWDCR